MLKIYASSERVEAGSYLESNQTESEEYEDSVSQAFYETVITKKVQLRRNRSPLGENPYRDFKPQQKPSEENVCLNPELETM